MILYVTFEPTEHDLYNLHDLQTSHTKLNSAQFGALRILIAQNLLRPLFIILDPVSFYRQHAHESKYARQNA